MAAIGVGDFERDLSLPWLGSLAYDPHNVFVVEDFVRDISLTPDMVAIGVVDCVKELSLTW